MNNRRMRIENLSPEQARTRLVILVISLIGFIATAMSRTQIDLSWTVDSSADTTYIERNF